MLNNVLRKFFGRFKIVLVISGIGFIVMVIASATSDKTEVVEGEIFKIEEVFSVSEEVGCVKGLELKVGFCTPSGDFRKQTFKKFLECQEEVQVGDKVLVMGQFSGLLSSSQNFKLIILDQD